MAHLQRVQFPCPNCGTPVGVEIAGAPSFINREYVSLIIIDHSGIVACPNTQCLASLQLVCMKADTLGIGLAPVEAKKLITTAENPGMKILGI